MKTTTSSYHAGGTLAPPCIHDLRFLYTGHLQLELRHHLEIRAEQHEAGVDTTDVDARVAALQAELDRRQRFYQRDPSLPAWPRMDDARYHQLLADARELKAIWPLDEFIHQVAGISLHGRRPELYGACPFHESASGRSFHVNTEKDVWHCFGCGTGGDLYRFVGEYFGITDFVDQVRKVEQTTTAMVESSRLIVGSSHAFGRMLEEARQ